MTTPKIKIDQAAKWTVGSVKTGHERYEIPVQIQGESRRAKLVYSWRPDGQFLLAGVERVTDGAEQDMPARTDHVRAILLEDTLPQKTWVRLFRADLKRRRSLVQ